MGQADNLHINDSGVKLLASRYKYALRGRLGLPLPGKHFTRGKSAPPSQGVGTKSGEKKLTGWKK